MNFMIFIFLMIRFFHALFIHFASSFLAAFRSFHEMYSRCLLFHLAIFQDPFAQFFFVGSYLTYFQSLDPLLKNEYKRNVQDLVLPSIPFQLNLRSEERRVGRERWSVM